MLGLFFLGRSVEQLYGPREFLRFYLLTVVFANVMWNVANKIAGTSPEIGVLRASGAVVGVTILFVLNFPRATILLFFALPIPAWLLGVLVVGPDLYNAIARSPSNIAYSVHLAGAAFAVAYFRWGWNLTRLWSNPFSKLSFRRRPRLRVHSADDEKQPDLSAEVDRILAKIYQHGEASLTAKERQFLESASRQYQRRQR